MKRYKIIPESDGRYRVKYAYSYIFPSWFILERYVEGMGYFSFFNSIDEAKQEIEKDKEWYSGYLKRKNQEKDFKRKNPPIYV
jgi:hypothetical protein